MIIEDVWICFKAGPNKYMCIVGTEAVNLLFLLRTTKLWEQNGVRGRVCWIREGGIKYVNVTERNVNEAELVSVGEGFWTSRRDVEKMVSGLVVKVSFIEEEDSLRVHFRSVLCLISLGFCTTLGNNNQLLCRKGEYLCLSPTVGIQAWGLCSKPFILYPALWRQTLAPQT